VIVDIVVFNSYVSKSFHVLTLKVFLLNNLSCFILCDDYDVE
jgi:hypothetical protein